MVRRMSKSSSASARPVADPDLVDRLFEFLADDPRLPRMDVRTLAAMKAAVRAEFRGEMCYIADRPNSARQQLVSDVLRLFNGRNVAQVARELKISRWTVRRYLRQAGVAPADGAGFMALHQGPGLPSDDA